MSLISPKKLVSLLTRGISRFPVPILAAVFATVCCILLADRRLDNNTEQLLIQLSLIAGLVFIANLLVELVLETSRAGLAKRITGNTITLGVVILYGALVVPGDIRQATPPFWYGYFILVLALHLGIALIPLRATKDPSTLWQFNLNLFLRFIFSSINSAIIYAGLALALVSIDKLFDVGLREKTYIQTWFVCAFAIHPLLCLGGIARTRELSTDASFPKALHFTLRFVGLPLTGLYLLIIYAYVAKILIQWSWPNGWVAMPICILSATSLLAYVLSIPLAGTERWAGIFKRWLPRLLFPLSIVLVLALQVRLGDYGVTLNRYLGIALGIWLFGISLSMLIKPRLHVAWIPASLLLVTLFSIFSGPLSASGWSERSQVSRIETLATDLGLWKDGRLIPAHEPKNADKVREFESTLRYVIKNHSLDALEDELSSFKLKTHHGRNPRSSYSLTQQIMEHLEINDDLNSAQLSFDFSGNVIPTHGHAWQLEYSLYNYHRSNRSNSFTVGEDQIHIIHEESRIRIKANESQVAEIDLKLWVDNIRQSIKESGQSQDAPLMWEIDGGTWQFSFALLHARIQANNNLLQNARFTVFVSKLPAPEEESE